MNMQLSALSVGYFTRETTSFCAVESELLKVERPKEKQYLNQNVMTVWQSDDRYTHRPGEPD